MIEPVAGILATFVAGIVLGLLFLLALWRSLNRLSADRSPALWWAGGALLRLALVMGVLFAILQLGDWRHVAAALAGFTLARWAAVRRLAAREHAPDRQEELK